MVGYPPVPGQELVEAVDFVIVDAGQDIGQVGFGVVVGEFGTFDEREDVGEVFAAGMGACEEPVASADGQWPDGSFGGVVVDGDSGFVEEQGEGMPSEETVSNGLGEVRFAGDLGELLFEPGIESFGQWGALGLADC